MSLLGDRQPALRDRQLDLWKGAGAQWNLTDLEAKAVYVAGMLRHLLESAGLCLSKDFHLPTYLLAVDAVELLGTVVTGRKQSNDETVVAGLAFLISEKADGGTTFATTVAGAYTIRDCVSRRHFAAHGARQQLAGPVFDLELTNLLLCRLASGIDRWWSSLTRDHTVQKSLSIARVPPLRTKGEVVFVGHLATQLLGGATPAGVVLHEKPWRGRCS